MNLVPPYTEDVIRRMAEECLREHHPSNTIPVPIEEIVEVHFGLDVVPANNLKATYDIDGYIARGQTIYVDGEMYRRSNPTRLRFTLAHELAHLRLHPRVFNAAAKYDTISGWMEFVQSIPAYQLAQIETQARIMAGYLLVPRDHFQREYARMSELLDTHGFDIKKMNTAVFNRVLAKLGEAFLVSPACMARQGAREGCWTWNEIPEGI